MVTSRVIPDAIADGGVPCFFITLFENVNTPHDHARARGWVELNEKPSEDRITE
jgi:tRNA A58 N-methylase Trm61